MLGFAAVHLVPHLSAVPTHAHTHTHTHTRRFIHGTDETRNKMLKLIPHIANGSWLIKQSVGTTPVIMGKALKTTYHVTPQVCVCVCGVCGAQEGSLCKPVLVFFT